MSYAKRVDGPHAAVVEAFRQLGYAVADMSGSGVKGFPDLLVANRDGEWLVEVKAKGGKLRDSQKAFQQKWPRHVWVITSPEDVLAFCRAERS